MMMMMTPSRKSNQRRREGRRAKAEEELAWMDWMSHYDVIRCINSLSLTTYWVARSWGQCIPPQYPAWPPLRKTNTSETWWRHDDEWRHGTDWLEPLAVRSIAIDHRRRRHRQLETLATHLRTHNERSVEEQSKPQRGTQKRGEEERWKETQKEKDRTVEERKRRSRGEEGERGKERYGEMRRDSLWLFFFLFSCFFLIQFRLARQAASRHARWPWTCPSDPSAPLGSQRYLVLPRKAIEKIRSQQIGKSDRRKNDEKKKTGEEDFFLPPSSSDPAFRIDLTVLLPSSSILFPLFLLPLPLFPLPLCVP